MNTSTPKDEQLSFLLEEKQCSVCKKVLPITKFYRHPGMIDGRRPDCKYCDSIRKRKIHVKNPEISAFTNLKHRAKRKNIPMELTREHLKKAFPNDMICPALGIKMEVGENNRIVNSPSIDRIIPEKGYVPGNIIVVSNKANRIKTDATPDEIIKVGKFYQKLLKEIEDGSKAD